MKAIRKIFVFVMALALVAGMAAAAVRPASAASCEQWHTVARGEYLSSIAREYATDWRTLAEINDLENPNLLYVGQRLCVDADGSGTVIIPDSGSGNSGSPTSSTVKVYADEVKEDDYVVVRGRSLAASTRYAVYLGRYDGQSYFAGYIFTDKNGAFVRTFDLPARLSDVVKLEIKVYNGALLAGSNWFINATSEDYVGGVGSASVSFTITDVDEDDWVEIRTSDLPENVTFDVRIGKKGSKGINGIKVGTIRGDSDGRVRDEFEIPAEYEGRSELDIRIENRALGMSYYRTFDND